MAADDTLYRADEIAAQPEWVEIPARRAGPGPFTLGAFVDRVFPRLPLSRRRRQERLIHALNEVASAMSSTVSPDDVLRTVVDEAKELVGTDKAVLCLFSSGASHTKLDDHAVFVRGRRDQYPEEWWRIQIGGVADAASTEGIPHVAMRDGAWLLTVPVKIKNRPIGVLSAINPRDRRFSDDQVSLMAILGAFAGTVIENARLHSQSHYALLADERSRIAKEMHDGLSQSLFSASLELDVCRKRRAAHPEEMDQRLERVQSIIVRSLSELRRYIYDLRPVSLDKLGLVGAIDMRAKEMAQAHGLSTRVYVEGDSRPLPPSVEACAYRVAQEAVSNVAKHARAQHAYVMVKYEPTFIELVIEDDGKGFDVGTARGRAARDESMGLHSMQDRVEAEGGSFEIHSSDRGSTVRVILPC